MNVNTESDFGFLQSEFDQVDETKQQKEVKQEEITSTKPQWGYSIKAYKNGQKIHLSPEQEKKLQELVKELMTQQPDLKDLKSISITFQAILNENNEIVGQTSEKMSKAIQDAVNKPFSLIPGKAGQSHPKLPPKKNTVDSIQKKDQVSIDPSIEVKIKTTPTVKESTISEKGSTVISQTEHTQTVEQKLLDPNIEEHTQTQLTGDLQKADSQGKNIRVPLGKDGKFGKNYIDRYSTVTKDREMTENTLKRLKEEQKTAPKEKKSKLNSQINYYENKLQNLDKRPKESTKTQKGDWVHSLGFRNLLKSFASFTDAISQYTAIPPNMRHQSVVKKDGSTVVDFVRMGAMTDLSNGSISLKTLKDIQKASSEQREMMINAELEKLSLLETTPTKFKGKVKKFFGMEHLDSKQRESINYAKSQLEAMKTDPKSIDTIIQERELRVRDQFLHLVNAQAEKGKIKDGKLDLAHVALLNPKKSKLDKTGWIHDEGTMLQDMEAIFNQYNGSDIKFHPDGPFVDSDGIIHLKGDPDKQSPVKLNAFLVNVNVQGKKVKDASYISQKLTQLLSMNPELKDDPDFIQIRDKLAEGKCAPHEIAEDFSLLLHKMGKGLSLGCMSVKDRTLVVAEGVVVKALKKHFTDKTDSKELQNLQEDIWKGDCGSSKVLQDDTNVRYAKFQPKWISSGVSLRTKIDFAWGAAKQWMRHGSAD